MNVGVNVFNSIEGSSSFGCGLFTFREICSNSVILGYEKVFQVKRVHTKGLCRVLEEMRTRMVITMERGLDILESYRRMAQQKVMDKLVYKILKSRLSLKVLPNYMSEEEVLKEGGYTLEEFKEVWGRINGSWEPDEVVGVYEFKIFVGLNCMLGF